MSAGIRYVTAVAHAGRATLLLSTPGQHYLVPDVLVPRLVIPRQLSALGQKD
jgi:hypothetical protein